MNTPTIRIGSRGSQLALWQANHIAAELRAKGHTVEVEVIRTMGDRMQDPSFVAPATFEDGTPLDAKGIFIKEIEEALAAGRIDLAVHSLKDLPTTLDPRFTLAAIPLRADARDAFVCENFWGLHMLPLHSSVATTSPRRKAMILALRPDIRFVEMRGNIDTRLRKWAAGEADALILAAAGLDRIGRTESVHQRFSVDELTPAPGQGALALETRNNSLLGRGFSPAISTPTGNPALAAEGVSRDAAIFAAIRALNCPSAEFATQAERHVLAALGGGCSLPLGAYCHQVDDHWHLHGMVASPDGEEVAHITERAPVGISAEELGHRAAASLTALGARALLTGNSVLTTD